MQTKLKSIINELNNPLKDIKNQYIKLLESYENSNEQIPILKLINSNENSTDQILLKTKVIELYILKNIKMYNFEEQEKFIKKSINSEIDKYMEINVDETLSTLNNVFNSIVNTTISSINKYTNYEDKDEDTPIFNNEVD
jgi:hypothetical protein